MVSYRIHVVLSLLAALLAVYLPEVGAVDSNEKCEFSVDASQDNEIRREWLELSILLSRAEKEEGLKAGPQWQRLLTREEQLAAQMQAINAATELRLAACFHDRSQQLQVRPAPSTNDAVDRLVREQQQISLLESRSGHEWRAKYIQAQGGWLEDQRRFGGYSLTYLRQPKAQVDAKGKEVTERVAKQCLSRFETLNRRLEYVRFDWSFCTKSRRLASLFNQYSDALATCTHWDPDGSMKEAMDAKLKGREQAACDLCDPRVRPTYCSRSAGLVETFQTERAT